MAVKLRAIGNALVEYSSEKFTELTPQKLAHIRLRYAIILQATMDSLYGTEEDRADAEAYFEGDVFLEHCEELLIDPTLMTYITSNPEEYADTIQDYDQTEEDEDDLYL